MPSNYCECEHSSHEREPNEICARAPQVEVLTDYGTFRVCAICADTHMINYTKSRGALTQ